MTIKLGSLFDGSGGFPLAGALCGIEPIWAAEVEPYPIAVTKSRFPNMEHLGDVSKINGADIEPVDLITFGSPCQDLSVAGLRKGLKHEDNGDEETTRSGLFMEAVRIIKEMREATNGIYPRFALWENVPGAFSSNKGEDFRIVCEELIKIAEPCATMPSVPQRGWAYADSYIGDGWSLAYRVFDAQYWGVPQRRRRIHLVVDFRGASAREVLFEREGLRGYFAEGRAPWQATPADAEGGSLADDREGAAAGGQLDALAYTMVVRSGCEVDANGRAAGKGALIQTERASTINTVQDQYLFQPTTYDTRGNGDGGTVGTLTGDHQNRVTDYTSVVCEPVCCLDGDKIGKAERAGGSGLGIRDGSKMYTLTAKDAGTHSVCIPIQDQATRFSGKRGDKFDGKGNGLGVGADGDPVFTLTGGDRHCVAYGIDQGATRDVGKLFLEETSKTLANGTCPGHHQGVVIVDSKRVQYIVRRLTPTECARLQGFADWWGHIEHKADFTDEELSFWLDARNTHAAVNGKAVKDYNKTQMLTWYNKLWCDGSEYKMWGNGIALPPALYCMQGITEVLNREEDDSWML